MKNLIVNRLEQVINYLNPLLSFANCHMVDFYTNDLYNRYISPEIQNEISVTGAEKTIEHILKETLPVSEYPNLNKFLADAKSNTLANFPEILCNLQDLQLKLIDLGCQNLSGFRSEVFMSSKKSHEVEILSEISAAICEVCQNEIVVDIGDGKGYLSSALALHSSLKVIGIDSSSTNTQNAAKRLSKFEKYVKHSNSSPGNEFYKQVTEFVTEETDLDGIVKRCFSKDRYSLIGLHTCGNLASSCLKIFVENPNVLSICNVGCCYHLLEEQFLRGYENGEEITIRNNNYGFPLSDFLQGKGFEIGRNARMLASQSTDRILHQKDLPSKILFYRALLQILLLKHHPDLVSKHVGKFKKECPNFHTYVEKSFAKFGTTPSIPYEEISNLLEKYLLEEKILQVFYLVRSFLAPVIETVILLDRLLYLCENNFRDVFLVKFFNPVISPRCYGVVGFKNVCGNE